MAPKRQAPQWKNPCPTFEESELEELASFVCGRYDVLMEMTTDPRITAEDFKRGAKKDARALATLNTKLRPWYTKKEGR